MTSSNGVRRLATIAFLLSVSSVAGQASAETPNVDERAATLFKQGKAAEQKRDWPEAYRLFRELWDLSPSYDVAANVAFGALKLQHVAEGASFLSYALRHFPATGDPKKRTEIRNYLNLAEKKVTSVTVSTDPPSAEVLVDGSAPLDAIFLEPGEHVVEARAPGHESARETVVATAGAAREVRLVLKPSLDPASATNASAPLEAPVPAPKPENTVPQPLPPPAVDADRSVVPALVAGSVALAGLAVGIGFTLAANSKESEATDIRRALGSPSSCSAQASPGDCDRLRDLETSEDRNSTVSAVGFVVGGLGAATAVAYLLWPAGGSATATSTSGRLRVAPALGRHGATFGLSGRF
jgi:hypothetical protein